VIRKPYPYYSAFVQAVLIQTDVTFHWKLRATSDVDDDDMMCMMVDGEEEESI